MWREGGELGALLIVSETYVGLERCLVAEEFIVVGLVGADGDIERRIEIHPSEIAFVIIVGEKRVRAQGEELLERGIGGESSSFAEKRGGASEIVVVFMVVRNHGELLRSRLLPPN